MSKSDADVLAEGRKYSSRSEFKRGSPYPYALARRRKLLDQLYPARSAAPRGLVYALAAPDGKEYIGQTAGPMYLRLIHHRRDTLRSKSRPICAAILKYGVAAFSVTILASGIADRAERVRLEAAAIAERNTLFPNGLNALPEADVVSHLHTRAARQKAEAGKKRFHLENPDAGQRMILSARKGFDPEQARALCLARNADPEFQKRVQIARGETLKNPAVRAKMKESGQLRAKLKDADFVPIMARIAKGETKSEVARSYKVSPQAINHFIKRNTFDSVTT